MNTDTERIKTSQPVRPLARRRPFQVAAGLAVAAVVTVLAYSGWSAGKGTGQPVPLAQVQRGALTISVSESGTVKNREQAVVKSEVEGTTTILTLIPEGTDVHKGDLLAELDASRLEDQKTQQQITVLNAEAGFVRARENLAVTQSQAESDIAQADLTWKFAQQDLKKYVEGEYPRELQKAESEITIASEELQRAEDKLEWSRKLAGEGYLTRTELQADELAMKRAEINLTLAKGSLDLLKRYTHQRSLDQLKSDAEQAQKALDRTTRRTAADLVQAKAELKAKESEFERQKTKLTKLGEQIGKCRIAAPVDGMVVYVTTGRGRWRGNAEPLEEGQQVRERQELIHLPTTSAMMVEVKVHEASLRKVARDMPVRITVDALPGQVFWGRVGKIALLPDAQSAWLNPDLKVYNTEIPIDGDASVLRPGMTCRADIIVEEHADALYVPVQSVVRVGGKPVVYVQTPQGPVARPVTVGLDNNRFIRIIAGLAEGEKVLLAPPLRQSQLPTSGAESGAPASRSAPATRPAPQPTTSATQPADKPAFDPSRLQSMTPEERRKWFQSLTPEQRESMRRRRGTRGTRDRGEPRTGRED